jgi:hypothetical protein
MQTELTGTVDTKTKLFLLFSYKSVSRYFGLSTLFRHKTHINKCTSKMDLIVHLR